MLVDSKTQDEDCRSIQTILAHVIHSGYGYAIAVRKLHGEQLIRPNKDYLSTIEAYKIAFDRIFEFNVQLFNHYPNVKLEELDNTKK